MKRSVAWALVIGGLVVASFLLMVSPLAFRALAFEPYSISSAAMAPTLQEGDYLVISKSAYGFSRHSMLGSPNFVHGRIRTGAPARGDVIAFKLPSDVRVTYVKRIVGLPGDRVQLRRGIVYVNGRPLALQAVRSITTTDRGRPEQATILRETTPEGRSYLIQSHSGDEPQANTGVYVTPPHCYFVLGDNRDNSADSRFDSGVDQTTLKSGVCAWDRSLDAIVGDGVGVGFVPEENLVGRATNLLRHSSSGGVESIAVQ